MYCPLNMEQISLNDTYTPTHINPKNNATFEFWQRALFQRAMSVLKFTLPDEWRGSTEDFFNYCLFRYGYLAVFRTDELGLVFNPCTLSGYNFYYQPTRAIVTNPTFTVSKELTIGVDCQLIKLCPDYRGIYDIVSFYAEKLANISSAIDMSLINSRFAFILGAKNKSSARALEKIMDKVSSGESTVIYDMQILNDATDKAEPWQFLERSNIKDSYLTTMQLADFDTLLKQYDTEIGIPTVAEKKERLVTSEAETKVVDSTTRSRVWVDTLQSSIELVNKQFGTNISVELRYGKINDGGIGDE